MTALSPIDYSLLVPRKTRISAFVVISVLLHVAVAGAGLWLSMQERSPRIDLDAKPIKASLVRLGKERDETFLPRKEPKPPPPPKEVKAPEPTPVAAAEPVPAPKPAAIPIPTPEAKPEPAPQPVKGEKTGEARRNDLFAAFDRTAEAAPDEELEGAADGDPLGDSAVQEGERYYGMLTAQIKRNYSLPDTLSEQERLYLKALIRIKIGRAGQLLDATLVKGSENSQFDNAVLAAVKRTAPFSPPPEHLVAQLEDRGVPMEFGP